MSTKPTYDDLIKDITDRAKALWGEGKAAEMTGALESTARQMVDIDRVMPRVDVEPGFYQ